MTHQPFPFPTLNLSDSSENSKSYTSICLDTNWETANLFCVGTDRYNISTTNKH